MSVHLENRWVLSYNKTIESKDFFDVNDCTKTPTHSWQRFHVSRTFSSFFLIFFAIYSSPVQLPHMISCVLMVMTIII